MPHPTSAFEKEEFRRREDGLHPGLYGDHEILTLMAKEAPKGPPIEVFWGMQEDNEPFYHAMNEYVETLGGADPLAEYEEIPDGDPGRDEQDDIIDGAGLQQDGGIPSWVQALFAGLGMEDDDVEQGLSDVEDGMGLGSSLVIGQGLLPALPWAAGFGEDVLDFFTGLPTDFPVSITDLPFIPLGDGEEDEPFYQTEEDEPFPQTMTPSSFEELTAMQTGKEEAATQRDIFEVFNDAYPDIAKILQLMDESEMGEDVYTLSDLQAWLDSPVRKKESGVDANFLRGIEQEFGIPITTGIIPTDGISTDIVAKPGPTDEWPIDEPPPAGKPGLFVRKDFPKGQEGDALFEAELARRAEVLKRAKEPPPADFGLLDPATGEPTGATVLSDVGPYATDEGDYTTARANLRAVFYPTIYQQAGVEQASETELSNLLYQTQILFFLEQGKTAWEDIGRYKSERVAYEEGDGKDRPALEKNYEKWLGGYLERPFAQRLNPAEGRDFYGLVKDVSSMLNLRYEDPSRLDREGMARWQGLQDRSVWVEGLFGGERNQDIRDELVKMGLTHGGTGYWSQLIHNAAEKQMDYYRNIGWTEERVFDQMTKGMKKPQAAQQLPTLGDGGGGDIMSSYLGELGELGESDKSSVREGQWQEDRWYEWGPHRAQFSELDWERGGYKKAGWTLSPNQSYKV